MGAAGAGAAGGARGRGRGQREGAARAGAGAQGKGRGFDAWKAACWARTYWHRLLGTSACWFAWDLAFYGNRLFQGTFIAIMNPDASVVQAGPPPPLPPPAPSPCLPSPPSPPPLLPRALPDLPSLLGSSRS